MILTPLLKLHKNGEDWGKLIVAKGVKKLAKIQNITQSGHTGAHRHLGNERDRKLTRPTSPSLRYQYLCHPPP